MLAISHYTLNFFCKLIVRINCFFFSSLWRARNKQKSIINCEWSLIIWVKWKFDVCRSLSLPRLKTMWVCACVRVSVCVCACVRSGLCEWVNKIDLVFNLNCIWKQLWNDDHNLNKIVIVVVIFWCQCRIETKRKLSTALFGSLLSLWQTLS